jgi:multidrug efflux pump subunit AcrA (membrane-fusion protein)
LSKPTIVCILGMHRSGTSLVSRVMNVLGVDLGPAEHLMRPSSDNPTGHWESRPLKEINDEILSILGGSWQEPPPLPAGWERSPDLAAPRHRAREVIEGDFSGSELWGFKDPRNSLTLPFWQRILDPMRYVICLRNPLDVAASAGARNRADDSVPFEQGVELWLTYVRAALAATAGHPRHLVFYEDLMTDPEPVVRGLSDFIGLDTTGDAESDIRTATGIAVTGGLWHHRTPVPNVVDTSRLPFHVKAYYVALRQFVRGVEAVGPETLDLLGVYAAAAGDQRTQLDAAVAELRQAREQARTLKRREIALEQRVAERDDQLQRAMAERDEEHRRHEAERIEQRRDRRRLESELEASRKEVRQLEASAQRRDSDARPSPGSAPRPGYASLTSAVRERAAELIPSGATVLVAGKGDEALLHLDGRTGWHFPMAEDGRYAGFHPAGDTAAIAQLEALRTRGADHLLLPKTTLWWLDHYEGLRRHLEDRYTALVTDEQCAIFRLSGEERTQANGPLTVLKRTIARLRIDTGRDPSILDWSSHLGIADLLPEEKLFAPPGDEQTLPYLDGTVDIVVLPADTAAARLAEARRVAASGVIRVDSDSPERTELEWRGTGDSGWGEDASITMIPSTDDWPWDATLTTFTEALNDGFAGEFSVAGDSSVLGPATERAAAAGVPLREVAAPAGTSVTRLAHAAAKGSDRRLQVFLTAPAVPLPGWLPSMLALLGPERDAGVVGARIVSRFGFLEEAGGILADGKRERRGEGDADPDRPEYRFVRRVDFCSPPLLATKRELFDRLGGVEGGGASPDDALVDFSLRAGQSGAPVYYQPEARVVALGNGVR